MNGAGEGSRPFKGDFPPSFEGVKCISTILLLSSSPHKEKTKTQNLKMPFKKKHRIHVTGTFAFKKKKIHVTGTFANIGLLPMELAKSVCSHMTQRSAKSLLLPSLLPGRRNC